MTQLQIQMKIGIDQSDYSKIERGLRYPTIDQLIALAEIFDTSIDYIVGLTDEKKPYPR
ncbi:MAG: helix-turn-helix transcriptional regulator [Ruminococcus sp.]|nr:helix-turn-helix transcriptional regulator [Ruminococcus sp.]